MWAEGRSGTDRERVGFPRNEKRKLDDGNSAQMEKQMNAAKALFESFGFRAAAGTSSPDRQGKQKAARSAADPSPMDTPTTANAPRRSNKEEQAFLYPNNQIERAQDVYINGTKYTDPKEPEEKPRRKRESNFFLTINANKVDQLRTVADPAWERGMRCVEDGLLNGACITFGPKDNKHFASDLAKDVIIDKPVFHFATEVGPKNGRLHAHAIIKMKHYSNLHLNRSGIEKVFKKAYNDSLDKAARTGNYLYEAKIRRYLKIEGKPYVDFRLINSTNYNKIMHRYIYKDNPAAHPHSSDDTASDSETE